MQIECKGIGAITGRNGNGVEVELEQVDMSFLEDVDASDIISWADNEKLLDAMDSDEVYQWVQNKYDVTIKEN